MKKLFAGKSLIVGASIIALLIVASVIAIGYGITRHTETGLMGACWSSDSVHHYEPNGNNDCPIVEWNTDSIPLGVFFTPRGEESENLQDIAQSAISTINNRLGFKALEWYSQGDIDIVLRALGPDDAPSFAGGSTYHAKDDQGRQFAVVEVSEAENITMQHAIMVHEFLHTLGLGHDDWEGSVMFPNQKSNNSPLGNPHSIVWISDHDKDLLRNLYAPR